MKKKALRPVLRSEDLPAGTAAQPELRRVRVGRRDVLLARLAGGEVVAFGARCPHQRTSLDQATLWEGHLRCPRHLYLYDLHTGENVLPARKARPNTLWKLKPGYLPIYTTEEHDGWIWVAQVMEPPPPGYDAAKERRPLLARRGEGVAVTTAETGTLEHPPEELEVRVGEEFDLVLPTSARPGHFWRVEVPPGLLTVLGQRFEADGRPRSRARLAASAAGEATVRCTYGTPVEAEPKEVRIFRIRIDPPDRT